MIGYFLCHIIFVVTEKSTTLFIILNLQKAVAKTKESLEKCLAINKKLLITSVSHQNFYSVEAFTVTVNYIMLLNVSLFFYEQSTLEKKAGRERCMKNRL